MITRRPVKAMDMDSFPGDIQDGVRFRLNARKSNDSMLGYGDFNDKGTIKVSDLPEHIVGKVQVAERNWVIILSREASRDVIGYVDLNEEKYHEIMSAQDFGCDWNFQECELINIQYDYISGCNELKIYFSSNWTYYHVNIDEMLDPERSEALKERIATSIPKVKGEIKCGDASCNYFKSFNCVCGVKTIVDPSPHGGYNLMAGVYQFAVRLVDSTGAKTNVFAATRPVMIGSENNIPGERSDEYITLHLDNLDCTYHMVDIIVIKTIAGAVYAEVVARRHYSNGQLSYEYYGTTGKETPISLQEVMGYGKTLLEGQDQFIFNNKMWYYNLKPHRNPNLQERVLRETKVKLAVHQVPYEDVMKYGYKSLMRGEKYLFAISYNVCGKGPTPSFVLRPDPDAEDNYSPVWNETTTTVKTEGGITKWRGASSEMNLEMRSSSWGAVQQSSVDLSEGSKDSTFEAMMRKHIEDMRTEVTDIARVLDCPPFVCDGECPGQEEGCDGACISNCDECECDYRRKRAEEVRKTVETGLKGCTVTLSQYIEGVAVDNIPVYSEKTVKQAALSLYEEAVEKKWQKAYTGRIHTVDTDASPLPLVMSGERSNNNSDIYGNTILNDTVKFKGTMPFISSTVDYTYPDTLDCDGNFLYREFANKPVELFEVPSAKVIPIVYSESYGVISENGHRPEWSGAFVNLVGIEVGDIPIPTAEELGGELCEDEPFTITMVERTMINSSVIAKGIIHGTFRGSVNGQEHAFPRHAVNSRENIDRFVNDKDNLVNGRPSRKGSSPDSETAFTFHSLDTAVYHMGLAVDIVYPELTVIGGGSRYGLYSEGEPPDNSMYGHRTDRRGARSAIHFNQSMGSDNGPAEVLGITYARANSVVTHPENGMLDLMNRYREGSVYFQTKTPLRVGTDLSFFGDTLEHTVEGLLGATEYVSLRRNISNQYGGLVNQAYVSTGLSGNRMSLLYKKVRGIIGDTFVGYTTVRRTSYISDKVGDKFNIPPTMYYPGGGLSGGFTEANRSVCDPPVGDLTSEFYNKLSLPESGDMGDPKNWAGLHTINGVGPMTFGQAKTDTEFPRTEYYYPRTLTHLNHYWGEFKVCPWLLQTGAGEQKLIQDVYYPKLKDAGFDSTMSGQPYKECFMEKFGFEVIQPTKAQLLKKDLIIFLVKYFAPTLGLGAIAAVDEGVQSVVVMAIAPLITALFTYFRETLLAEDKLDEIFGIPTCKTDIQGAQEDHAVVGFKDNYTEYNTDYSSPDRINNYYGMGDPYYTCHCEDIVNGETSSEIKFSSLRMEGSPIDGYLRVSPWDSVNVPGKMGELRKLFTESGRFYAHTNKFILTIQEGKTSIPTVDGKELIIGGGTMLEIPDSLYEGVPEGFMGIDDPNASIITPFGYIFANRTGIYIIGGKSSTVITNQGLSRFFNKHLPMECEGCRDQLNGLDYMFGMDYRNNMILFTKKACDCSFTVGYSLADKGWYSFYSFTPDMYMWSDSDFYSVKDKALWKHGYGPNQTYYGKVYPHILEFPFAKGITPIEFKSLLLDTIAYEGTQMDTIRTFDEIGIYTMTQSSGIKPMKLHLDTENLREGIRENLNEVRVDRNGRFFHLNRIQNDIEFGQPVLDNSCPIPLILPTEGVGKFKERFFDDYIMVRLINNTPKELLTRSVTMHEDSRLDG